MRKKYPTDLSEREWARIEKHFRVSYKKGGRPPKYSKREILEAIFYVLRTGCQWWYLPNDFPLWKTVYEQFRQWKKQGIFEKMNYEITKYSRRKIGRNEQPSACIVDSQSVKTTEKGGSKAMMEGKKVKGRKRHIITDTQGFILGCYVGAANENDRDGMKIALNNMRTKYTKVKKMWADMGYQGRNLKNHIKEEYDIDIEIVKRPPCRFWVHKDTPPELLPTREQGFKVQPRRWVVERTFAWVNRNRRLSKEYDLLTTSTENFIYLAMSRVMLKREYA
ncbi:IS5-like element ISWpi1 family transposase [Wolbachia endosymbiont of Drosophila aff. chauvacae BK-2020]|uniref:IS5-like element ISWpi1 family transposase n=1 Tax=Wolbachia endosymbiont of Drosophila aff. chauvacae BK-2020 TaxID=3080329 RepID=UPI002937017A|nr:IS5-like element ISWpi1 family transposase [Wolbachia endosymbiont of Drosophila aff. chauvacae BK-2020]WOE62254.1 IS5-like element ISWpi1 family transposase [Wolbachia endosymbiont of Drosophila aff. chauvacae BK-2020]WOE63242.1 IS5-like element ISWpi1 family transposase [Wolbachia endosymbiont of Drosophila aff. chauvacae BK-2020]